MSLCPCHHHSPLGPNQMTGTEHKVISSSLHQAHVWGHHFKKQNFVTLENY